MDVRQVKEIVRRRIENLNELYERLDSKGEPLTLEQKSLLRQTLLGWVEDMQTEQFFFLWKGSTSDYKASVKQIVDTFEGLT